MRTTRAAIAGTIVMALVCGVGGPAGAQEDEAERALSATYEIPYAGGGPVLDVYAPDEPGPWPVIVLAHGMSQHKAAFTSLAEAIASDGAVVYNVDWTYHPIIPDATDRIACAVRFARATAAEHGGDAGRITLVGHSAGATMGLVVALAGDEYGADCLATDEPARVDAFVGYEGPYGWRNPPETTPPLAVPLPADADPAVWRAIDPYEHIGGNGGLVVRLVHGDAADFSAYDTPLEMSVELDQALLEAGYDSAVTVVPDAAHSTILDHESAVGDTIRAKLAETTLATAE